MRRAAAPPPGAGERDGRRARAGAGELPDGWSMERAEGRLGHLLWETAGLTRSISESAVAGLPLSKMGLGCLMRIADQPGITVTQLARDGFATQQSVSQVAGRLERLGYVERRLGSGRGIGLYITDVGTAAMIAGDARERECERQYRQLLGDERYATLCELLSEARARLREHRDAAAHDASES
jgi:DNA-binding MarR family transcriptional regulator